MEGLLGKLSRQGREYVVVSEVASRGTPGNQPGFVHANFRMMSDVVEWNVRLLKLVSQIILL